MDLKAFTEHLIGFDTTDGREAPAQDWLRERLVERGFETYEWEADASRLAEHPSFPDDPAEIATADRPSVAGVLEFGDPDAGPTLVLNGHVDVVPAEDGIWSSPPFEPTWDGDDLTARGAVDMKSAVAAMVYAARDLADSAAAEDLDGRVVVECVAGEEEGGIGAAAAAMDNPYPFERDAMLIAEPTDLEVVVATEGLVMKRLHVDGRSAHAATRWVGEDVIPHFQRIREAFVALEAERGESVTHPLYEEFPVPWPVCIGRVEAGSWGSTVPASLDAEIRIGVAPGESVDEVEAVYEERLAEVVAESEWLTEHPPSFERVSIQFEPGEIAPDEPVVTALQAAMEEEGLEGTEPTGRTYGADARHYIEAGIPTVVFGPGAIEQAHFPDETVHWPDVETARRTFTAFAREYLGDE